MTTNRQTNTNTNTSRAFAWDEHFDGYKVERVSVWEFADERGKWDELTARAQVALSAMSKASAGEYRVTDERVTIDYDGYAIRACLSAACRALLAAAARLGYREGESIEEWQARAEYDGEHISTGAAAAVARYLREYGELMSARGQLARGVCLADDVPRYCGGDSYEWVSRACVAWSEIFADSACRAALIAAIDNNGGALRPCDVWCVVAPQCKPRKPRENRVVSVFSAENGARVSAAACGADYEVMRLSRLLAAAACREDRDKAYFSVTAVTDAAKAAASTDGGIERIFADTNRAAEIAARVNFALDTVLASYADNERGAVARFVYELKSAPFVTFKGESKPNISIAAAAAFPELSADGARSKARRILAKLAAALTD